jgi:hypothetical protein
MKKAEGIIIVIIVVAAFGLALLLWYGISGDSLRQAANSQDSNEPLAVPTSNRNISVSTPQPNAQVSSPFIVSGSAVAFENTVQIVLRNDAGRVVSSTFATTDAKEPGAMGRFEVLIAFNALSNDQLTLEVFEEDAASGVPIHMVRIPIFVKD